MSQKLLTPFLRHLPTHHPEIEANSTIIPKWTKSEIFKNSSEMEKRGVAGTAYNAHIAKIAALPRVDRFCVFLLPLFALIKCWNAATSPSRGMLVASGGRVQA